MHEGESAGGVATSQKLGVPNGGEALDAAGKMGPQPGPNLNGSDPVRARMNEFARSMQSGNFQLAAQQIERTLELLATTTPRRDKEILACVSYKITQKILIRIRAIEKETAGLGRDAPIFIRRAVEAAVLTMVLTSLKGLLPRHRVAAMKMAVEKNMMVENYGVSAGWLRTLIEMAPSGQKPQFLSKLQVCEQNGGTNAKMPLYNRLCYLTLSLIPPPVLKCNYCPATYNPRLSGVVSNSRCRTCLQGTVISAPR